MIRSLARGILWLLTWPWNHLFGGDLT